MRKITMQAIIDAFVKLLQTYRYDEISVEMIIKKAGVSKTTFYRYFIDKADIMDRYFREIYDRALLDHKCSSLKDLFTILLQNARENPEQYAMFETTGHNSYSQFVYRYTYRMGKEIMESAWGRKLNEAESFHIGYFCAGGSYIMEQWSIGKQYTGMSSQQAAEEIISMMNEQYLVAIDVAMKSHIRQIIEKRNYFID